MTSNKIRLPKLDFRCLPCLSEWDKGYLCGMHDLIYHYIRIKSPDIKANNILLEIFTQVKTAKRTGDRFFTPEIKEQDAQKT